MLFLVEMLVYVIFEVIVIEFGVKGNIVINVIKLVIVEMGV